MTDILSSGDWLGVICDTILANRSVAIVNYYAQDVRSQSVRQALLFNAISRDTSLGYGDGGAFLCPLAESQR